MSAYFLYAVSSIGKVGTVPLVIECADDEDAISMSVRRLRGSGLELWQEDRFVKRFAGLLRPR